MFNASQAVQLSRSFDQEARYQQMHDQYIHTIETCIQVKCRAGETLLRWVPTINPGDAPQVVIDKIIETLKAAGYTVREEMANMWTITWA